MDDQPEAPKPPSRWVPRAVLMALWRLAVILTVIVFVYPEKLNAVRHATLAGGFCVWAGALILWWPRIPVRVACIIAALLAIAVCVVPGRAIDPAMLRDADTRALTDYMGDRYLWGGETPLGIDCSGLIRRGAIDAYLSVGWRTLNPAAFREAFRVYWRDCSADDLGHGYGDLTRFVTEAESLDAADLNLLRPGDMAIVEHGAHILAYLGAGRWIDADPLVGRVVEAQTPAPTVAWFRLDARIMRWRAMETAR